MKKTFKILGITSLSILVIFLLIFCFKYNKEVKIFSSISKMVNLTKETPDKNILLLGIAGQESNGGMLTDAIMVANIDFDKNKVNLISIPRDILVQDPKTNQFFKLNYLYFNENVYNKEFNKTDNIRKKVEQITGLEIHNTVVVDLDGFRYFIDSLGGIDIVLPEVVYDPKLKNPNNPTQPFYLPKGENHLDGKTAAKFIRTRNVQEGDIKRGSNQQILLQAVLNQVKKDLSLPGLMKIYNSWKGYMYTDMSINDMISYAKLMQNFNSKSINNITLSFDKENSLLLSKLDQTYGYILIPKEGIENYKAIKYYVFQNISKD